MSPEAKVFTLPPEPKRYELPRRYGLHTDVYLNKEIGGEPNYEDQLKAFKDQPEWTDQETLLLLEALEIHRDDWFEVADYVNHHHHDGETVRTQDDCLLAFIRLPIEDPYLQITKAETTQGASPTEPYPLAASGNPLMATLSFLTQAVHPEVASAGASKALASLLAAKPLNSDEPTAGEAGPAVADAPSAMDTSGDATGEKTPAAEPATTPAAEEAGRDLAQAAEPPRSPADDPNKASVDSSADSKKMADPGAKSAGVDPALLQKLSREALSSAADKARVLATAEEQRMRALTAMLVQTQLQKLELKLRCTLLPALLSPPPPPPLSRVFIVAGLRGPNGNRCTAGISRSSRIW